MELLRLMDVYFLLAFTHRLLNDIFELQVDKDTMEMLKSIGMGNMPNVTLPQVCTVHLVHSVCRYRFRMITFAS
jgi:hypothetical protein